MAAPILNNSVASTKSTQVFIFTENGFLLDSCDSLFDLTKHRSQSLFELLPFVKRYTHIFKDLGGSNIKQFKNISLEFDDAHFLLDVVFFKESGNLICVVESNEDIGSETLMPLESKYEQQYRQLEADFAQTTKLQKIRQDIFSKIVHDIKLPLTEIVGTTYLLKQFVASDKGEAYLRSLSSAASNLNRMLNDLMEFSKSEAYKFNLESKPFNLTASIVSVINAFAFKTQELNIPIFTDFDSSIPEIILGDSTRLSQVIYNLFDNALKFTKQGHIEIKTNIEEIGDDNCLISFEIIDSGIGIPQDSLNQIFETYKQVNENDAQKGFGLGLSIVKQLVELQGGHISVSSQLGIGTIFKFVIPFGIPT